MSGTRVSQGWAWLLLLSGLSGLGLQGVWTRAFAVGLGHESPAMLGVVTAVFGGLAAGAGAWSWIRRLPWRPSTVCGALEAVIGIWAITTAWTVPIAGGWLMRWMGPMPSGPFQAFLSIVGPLVVLLPATTAMGGTLPAVERLVSEGHRNDRNVGPLYALNTLGAVLGVMVSVGWLQPRLGLKGTSCAFGVLNLICAAGFLLWGRLHGSDRDPGNGWKVQEARAGATGSPTANAATSRWSLPLLAWTGFLGIGFEVLATRLLGQALEGTVFSHAAVLGVFLAGTALGGALRNRWVRDPDRALPTLLLGQAASLVVSGFVVVWTPAWHPAMRAILGDGKTAMLATEWILAAAVVGAPTVLMGLLFSSLATLAMRGRPAGLGWAVAFNTLGSALAPAAVGLGMIPWLGSRWTWVALVVGYCAPVSGSHLLRGLAFGVVGVALLGLPRFMDLQLRLPGSRLVEVREGAGDTVAVVEQPGGNRALRLNNRFTMGGTASTNAERRHGHLPLLWHPAPRRALFLGVGTGISFAAMDAHPGLKAQGVELVPEAAGVLDAFRPHNAYSTDLAVHVADARRHVRTTTASYDVIVADLFHPARDGAAGLYTREHFAAVRERLSEGGVFCQWLPLFQLDEPTLRVIVRTYLLVFPEAQAFLLRYTADTPVLGLVGGRGPLRFDEGWMARRTRDGGLQEALKPLVLTEDIPVFGLWFAGPAWLSAFAGDADVNTDDHPVVLFQAPQTLVGRATPGHALLERLLARPAAVPEGLFTSRTDATAWNERLAQYRRARDAYLSGLIAEASGQREAALDRYIDSARLSADFTTGYAQVLARASQSAKTDPDGVRRLLDRLTEARPDRGVAADLKRRLGL
jgi:spermidine synthase